MVLVDLLAERAGVHVELGFLYFAIYQVIGEAFEVGELLLVLVLHVERHPHGGPVVARLAQDMDARYPLKHYLKLLAGPHDARLPVVAQDFGRRGTVAAGQKIHLSNFAELHRRFRLGGFLGQGYRPAN